MSKKLEEEGKTRGKIEEKITFLVSFASKNS